MERLHNEARHALRGNLLTVGIVALYVLAVSIVAWRSGFSLPEPVGYLVGLRIYANFAFIILGVMFLWRLAKERPDRPLATLPRFTRDWRLLDRLRAGWVGLSAVIVFSVVFQAAKAAIPLIHPFYLDPVLVQLDQTIFGRDAWEVLQPVLGYPFVTFVLNLGYHLWGGLMIGSVLLACALIERPALRTQYLTAYLASWILLGTVGALFLSSVGPCFYEAFYGDGRFRPLMAYLQRADQVLPLMTLDVQQRLIDWAAQHQNGFGRGISAMPSMHVSIACLLAFLGWSFSRLWGIVGSVFLALVTLGSVHLGYHYAADSLVSLAVTPVIWWGSGQVARIAVPVSASPTLQ